MGRNNWGYYKFSEIFPWLNLGSIFAVRKLIFVKIA